MNQLKGAAQFVRITLLGISLCCLSTSVTFAKNIGLFYHDEFVDIEEGNIFSEASNVKTTLEYLGHQVTVFGDFETLDLEGIDLIIMPELEKQSLVAGRTSDQLEGYKEYINSGGGVLVMGVVSSEAENNTNGIEFLNYLIDGHLQIGEIVLEGTSVKSSNFSNDDFEAAPETLNNNNAMVFITSGFMEGSSIIYNNEGEPGQAAVAQFTKGEGSVVYFGWGWWNALPTGSQDGGWLDLLKITIEVLSCDDCEDMDPLSLNQEFQFSGKATNGAGNALSAVEVVLESGTPKYLLSNESGVFLSDELLSGKHTLHINKETSVARRVSSFDLRLMERHILGLEEFTSGYQYIAADMNGDKVLDLKDLVIVKKIILNQELTETLSSNWRWVSADFEFDLGSNPLFQNWDQLQESEVDFDNQDIHVIGIKSGDVDFSN